MDPFLLFTLVCSFSSGVDYNTLVLVTRGVKPHSSLGRWECFQLFGLELPVRVVVTLCLPSETVKSWI